MQPVSIKINEIVENGVTYFLATSEQVEGFMAEGDTLDEVLTNANIVMRDFLCNRLDTLEKKHNSVVVNYETTMCLS